MTAAVAPIPRASGGREVLTVLATRGGILAFGLLTQSLLAYGLLTSERGAFATCSVFALLLSLLFAFSADRGAQYFVIANRMSVSQSVSLGLCISLLGSAAACAAAIPLIHSELGFFQKADPASFYWALILLPLRAVNSVAEMQLMGLRRFKALGLCMLLQSLSVSLAMTGLLLGLDLGVEGALFSMALGQLVSLCACFWQLRQHAVLVWEMPSLRGAARLLQYGGKYHGARIGMELEMRAGTIALGLLAGRADIGLFAVAIALMSRFNIIANAVASVLFPRVPKAAAKDNPALFALCLRYVAWVMGGALLAFLAVSEPLVRLLLSEAYVPIVPLLWILALGIFAYGISAIYMTYFSGIDRPEICTWSVWISLCVNGTLLLALFPRIGGLSGTAWAMSLGLLCRCGFLSVMFHRSSHETLLSTWRPQRSDLAYLRTMGRSLLRRAAGEQPIQT